MNSQKFIRVSYLTYLLVTHAHLSFFPSCNVVSFMYRGFLRGEHERVLQCIWRAGLSLEFVVNVLLLCWNLIV